MDNVVLTLVCRGRLNLIRSLPLNSSSAFLLLAEMFDAWLYCDYDQQCVTGHLISRVRAQGLMPSLFRMK
jgi:hypothetical protein